MSFYRIPQETLQVALMGKLRVWGNKYSGKSLAEIALDEGM
jgi:hypothetical protein